MSALQPIAAVFLTVHVLLFLTAQHDRAVLDACTHVFALHSGQFCGDTQHRSLVDNVDARLEARGKGAEQIRLCTWTFIFSRAEAIASSPRRWNSPRD
ncbi:hypothetical protein OKW50_004850 [Paraburkholderia youngii]